MLKPSPERRLASAGVTDVGRQRKHNEDSILVRGDLGLFCVADGMGGHNAGDVASKLVITSIANYFEATRSGAGGAQTGAEAELGEDYAKLPPSARRLVAAVAKANRDVHTISTTHHQHHGMGSTCVAMHIADGVMSVAHVGDSRGYRIRGGEIQQLTRDHSLINDALEMKPDLTKEELARLPKNIITRALGMKEVVKVDVKSEPVLPGDMFLLCSDGLTGMISVEEILGIIALAPDAQEACELLVAEANDHGGTDNISALLVKAPLVDDAADVSATLTKDAALAAFESAPTVELRLPSQGGHPSGRDGAQDGEVRGSPTPSGLDGGVAQTPPEGASGKSGPTAATIPLARPSSSSTSTKSLAAIPPTPPVPRRPSSSGAMEAQRPATTSSVRPTPSRPPATPSRPPAAIVLPPSRSGRPPLLEVLDDDEAALETTQDLVLLGAEEEAALFAANAGRDLDLHGVWSDHQERSNVARCRRCKFELLPGNLFCVECGLRIQGETEGETGSG